MQGTGEKGREKQQNHQKWKLLLGRMTCNGEKAKPEGWRGPSLRTYLNEMAKAVFRLR